MEQNRAFVTGNADSACTDKTMLQSLIVDTTEDVFRRVLSFLGHGMNVSD